MDGRRWAAHRRRGLAPRCFTVHVIYLYCTAHGFSPLLLLCPDPMQLTAQHCATAVAGASHHCSTACLPAVDGTQGQQFIGAETALRQLVQRLRWPGGRVRGDM